MKIKPQDYEYLKTKLSETVKRIGITTINKHYKELQNNPRVKDINKRLRWDLFWASKVRLGDGKGINGDLDLYAYMDDSHIDTALKNIVRELI